MPESQPKSEYQPQSEDQPQPETQAPPEDQEKKSELPPNMEAVEQIIGTRETFRSLYFLIKEEAADESGYIIETAQHPAYHFSEVIKRIEAVRNGKGQMNLITRKWGIREKAEELIEKEQALAKQIARVESFDQLESILLSTGGIEGSQKWYSAQELRDIIESVRNNKNSDPRRIPRTAGLRNKVLELMRQEASPLNRLRRLFN